MTAAREIRRAASAWIRRRSPVTVVALSLLMVAAVGMLDDRTGLDIAVSLFYLIPVAFAAWHGGRDAGLVVSALAAATWIGLDDYMSLPLSVSVHAWNAAMRLGFFVVTALLVARLRRAIDALDALARSDALTGIPNRRALMDALEAETSRSRRSGGAFSLAFFDLDGFKLVNDRRGHAEGDRVLVAVARAATAGLVPPAMLARVGGDEFAVLLPRTAEREALDVVEGIHARVRAAMRAGGWETDMSAGVVTFPEPPAGADEALHEADRLQRQAKTSGKGRVLSGCCAAAPGDAAAGASARLQE